MADDAQQGRHGLFITFEGGEGAGKTTQIQLLKDYLGQQQNRVVITREPGGTEEAEKIRDLLVDRKSNWTPMAETLLLFAARTMHADKVIRPALKKGETVISDRFTDSTRVYQGMALGLGVEQVDRIREISIDELEPDITFIMDVKPETGRKRAQKRTVETGEGDQKYEQYETPFHDKLRQGYLNIAEKYPERCIVINAEQPIEDIHNDIIGHLKHAMQKIGALQPHD